MGNKSQVGFSVEAFGSGRSGTSYLGATTLISFEKRSKTELLEVSLGRRLARCYIFSAVRFISWSRSTLIRPSRERRLSDV